MAAIITVGVPLLLKRKQGQATTAQCQLNFSVQHFITQLLRGLSRILLGRISLLDLNLLVWDRLFLFLLLRLLLRGILGWLLLWLSGRLSFVLFSLGLWTTSLTNLFHFKYFKYRTEDSKIINFVILESLN